MKKNLFGLMLLSGCIAIPQVFASEVNTCIEHIDEYYSFHTLYLDSCAIEDKDIASINVFLQNRKDTYLILRDNKITAAGAAELAIDTIQFLDISKNNIKDEGVVAVANSTSLSGLAIESTQVSDKGIIALAQNKNLKYLYIGNDTIGVEAAKELANNTTLEELGIVGNPFDHEGISAFAKNTSLNYLSLYQSKLNTSDLQEYAKLSSLVGFIVFGSDIGDEGLKAITALTNLEAISLINANVNDQNVVDLSYFPKLSYLNLDNYYQQDDYPKNHFSAKGMETLAIINSLGFLGLNNTNIDDEGASILAASNITDLVLSNNNIGDAGAIALSHSTFLQFLLIENNHIGKLGREALKASSIQNVYLDGNEDDLKVAAPLARKNIRFNPFCKLGSRFSAASSYGCMHK